jgi:hypothetical protein
LPGSSAGGGGGGAAAGGGVMGYSSEETGKWVTSLDTTSLCSLSPYRNSWWLVWIPADAGARSAGAAASCEKGKEVRGASWRSGGDDGEREEDEERGS